MFGRSSRDPTSTQTPRAIERMPGISSVTIRRPEAYSVRPRAGWTRRAGNMRAALLAGPPTLGWVPPLTHRSEADLACRVDVLDFDGELVPDVHSFLD